MFTPKQELLEEQDYHDLSSGAHGQVEEDNLPNKYGVLFTRKKRGEITVK